MREHFVRVHHRQARKDGWPFSGPVIRMGRYLHVRTPLNTGIVCADAAEAVAKYRSELTTFGSGVNFTGCTRAEIQSELRGKDLACWCPLDRPCHADVLLEIANTVNQGSAE